MRNTPPLPGWDTQFIMVYPVKILVHFRIALVSNGLAQTYQPARLGIYSATALLNGRYFYTHEDGMYDFSML